MKKTFFVIALCFACLSYSQFAFASIDQIKKESGYISVSGSDTKEVNPNFASVTFAVENTASDAKKAVEENNVISNKIVTALKTVTTADTDVIKTNNFSVRPNYSKTNDGKSVIKNYTAVNSISVETKDVNKISNFIKVAISSGANRTEGLYYSYESSKDICNDLYPALIKSLSDQAVLIAKSAGTTVDGIKHINASCNIDTVVSNGRFYAKAMSGASSDSAQESLSTPVESGKVKVRVYINADFYVK